jgi:1,4-alpha-glucan branching enzyme
MAKATAKTTKAPAAKKAAVKAAPAKKTATKAAAPKAAKPAEKKAAVKAPAKKAAAPKASKKVTVVFEANCPLATTVSVAGTFNNWAIDKDMLKKDKKTGLWVGKVALDAGQYEYKFVCDGQYWDEGDNKIKNV